MFWLNKILDSIQVFNSILLAFSLVDVLSYLTIILTLLQIVLIVVNFILKFKNAKTDKEKIEIVDETRKELDKYD